MPHVNQAASLYHLGCGERRLDGYVNVDLHPTSATDVVTDLTHPELSNAAGVFSNAFFEHLRRTTRVEHLRAIRRALQADGFACYLGLPDFRRVAELYLSGGPGVVGPRFDLFNVYRYTHGDPEMSPAADWEAQLHKSLFDVPELMRLLRDAGFPSYVVFRYVFPGEPPETDLSLGFYATADRRATGALELACRRFLAAFDGQFLTAETLRFDDGRSRLAGIARLSATRQRSLLGRVAFAASDRLARIA
jgi:predicted SAM-dependent methyltransferase